jgi:hypothetical protein
MSLVTKPPTPSSISDNTNTPIATTGASTPATIVSGRNLGGIVAEVTVSEEGLDELEITQHPVQTGAQVTDHSFKRPVTLTVRVGWSDAFPAANGDVKTIYDKLLALQASRQPFQVVTGKRTYSTMLFRSLALVTDQTTENALMITAICQEVILVSVSTVSVPNNSQQASPQKTGAVQNQGQVQPRSATPNTGPNSGALGQVLVGA